MPDIHRTRFGQSLLAGMLLAASASAAVVESRGAGSATYTWDPDAPITIEDSVVTSVPSTFTGPSVATIIGASTFYSHGYTGTGTIALNVEGGHIWDGHETLTHATNRTGTPNVTFGSPAYDRHATWTGMMIGGRQAGPVPGAYQEGIAPNTDLRSGAIATTWNGTAYTTSFNTSAANVATPYVAGFGTADVINSSFGGSGTPDFAGGTDFISMIADSLANQNRFTTLVAAAGNSGPATNTVGAPGSGYNSITVGALANNGSNGYTSVASFSSRGPQDYRDAFGTVSAARAPVDIVAPGASLTSAFYGGQTGGNDNSLAGSANFPGSNFYSGGLNGTSFAAPITAGSVALMHQAAAALSLPADSEDTRVVKANLLNAATKISGWSNGQVAHPNGNGGVRTTQALDYTSGAGALDMTRTYNQYLLGQTDIAGTSGGSTSKTIGWDYATVANGGNTDVVITTPLLGGSEFRVTLSWFRERTYTDATTQTDVGYADLDLEVWNSTFTTLISDSISAYTPVEHLTFNLPSTGTYGIRVSYFGNVFGSLTSEEYGLAWWGTAAPEPASLSLLAGGVLMLARRSRKDSPVNAR